MDKQRAKAAEMVIRARAIRIRALEMQDKNLETHISEYPPPLKGLIR
jgi:hypothetical protein